LERQAIIHWREVGPHKFSHVEHGVYVLSFFLLPKGVLNRLDFFRSRFFWQGDSKNKKYRLAKWSVVCTPKDQGGLGIQDLEVKNTALLGKWLFNLLTEDGIWQKILRRKYVGSKAMSQVLWKPGGSHFWAGLMATTKFFFGHGSFSIRDGSGIRFWEDKWLGNASLREQYSALYAIVHHSDTLAQVLGSNPPNVMFRRTLFGPRLVNWEALLLQLANIQITSGKDIFGWNLLENGKFSVAFMYNALTLPDVPVYDNKKIWKMKIPLKNKIFAWYLCRGVILTKDNLIKRNWHGNKTCVFCSQDETIKHLFFHCNFARSIWSVIQAAFGLYTPTIITNIFRNWLHGIDYKYMILLRVGAMTLIWLLWLCRNDKKFNDKNCSLLQVIYHCTRKLRV
jgi:hypothetical protein